jgi:filamentous hemagglutinin family protein
VVPTALALLIVACSSEAWAGDSVQADATLAQPTVVTPVIGSGGKTTYAITEGTTRGGYLFHSFASFGLLSHEMAHFNQAASIQSIFARVTGIQASQIDGLIKANGSANLYLINPKGIVFGPNASVNVGGAFVASTAKAVDFGSYSFSAETGNDVPVLLSSNITPGLQPGATGSLIKNQGVLTVQEGKALLLSSDRIEISGGSITSTTNSGTDGGSIQLIANTITLDQGAVVVSNTTGSGRGGPITIDAGALTLTDGSGLATLTSGTGAAGVINLNTTTPRPLAIAFSGNSLINATTTQVGPGGGQGGTISIGTPSASLAITGDGRITAETQGSGNGGRLDLNGSSIALKDKVTAASQTSGSGKGGTIALSTGTLQLDPGTSLSSFASASGAGGAITVAPSSAAPLSIAGSGLIETTATGSGNAGAIRIGTNGTSGSPIASNTTLSDGVRLKTSRSSVDLSSTGTTSVQGGSIEALGSSVQIRGDQDVRLKGVDIRALDSTVSPASMGSISVTGGAIEGGESSGRTILLAGSGALKAGESAAEAPNLTLLDGGDGSAAA